MLLRPKLLEFLHELSASNFTTLLCVHATRTRPMVGHAMLGNHAGWTRVAIVVLGGWLLIWSAVAWKGYRQEQFSKWIIEQPIPEYSNYVNSMDRSLPNSLNVSSTEIVEFWENEGREGRAMLWIALWALVIPLLILPFAWWVYRGFKHKTFRT